MQLKHIEKYWIFVLLFMIKWSRNNMSGNYIFAQDQTRLSTTTDFGFCIKCWNKIRILKKWI